MPAWLLIVLKSIAVSRLKDWLAKNALRWGAKIVVESSKNQWDNEVYDVVVAIVDNEPTAEIRKQMNDIVKLIDESSKEKG
jgi:hypothetical protein